MSTKKQTTETNTSFLMILVVLTAAAAGTYINAIIAMDWFSESMSEFMAVLMSLCLTALEFAAAHYLFKESSGWFGRLLCFVITSSCVVAFLIFGTLPVLVNQISKTQIDVTKTNHYLSVSKKIAVIDSQIDQSKIYRDQIKADVVACDASYPVPKWRTKNGQCKKPFQYEIKEIGKNIATLQNQKLAVLDQQSDLIAASPTPTKENARSQAMAVVVGIVTGTGISKSLQIGGVELVIALIRSIIAELSILFGAWALNRFTSDNPLNLLVQLLYNFRTTSVQNQLNWLQRRKFDTKFSTDSRNSEYMKLIKNGQIDDFSSSGARSLNIRNEAWRAAMTQMVIQGYLMSIHFSEAKQLNYRRPTVLDGAIDVGKGKNVVMRLPSELRLNHGAAQNGFNPDVIDIMTKRGA